MPKRKKGKKGKGAKGTKVTLKMAEKAIQETRNGCHRLTLSNMGITIFPKCLLKLTNVDELDLSHNLIKKLPDNIGDLESLRWVDLHSNKLESLPDSLGKLASLTYLNLSNNLLTSAGLPSALSTLSNLKSLNLGMNQLDTLPPSWDALASLQELGLFDNLFIKLPEFVNTYPNLTKLNAKRNPCSQGESGEGLGEKKEAAKDAYLVHGSSLCRTCFMRCQKEQSEDDSKKCKDEAGGEEGGSDMSDKKKPKTFSGLRTPNSVAVASQDVWRMK